MGFLMPAERAVALGIARAMRPPPPPDITGWCERNIVFDARSPMPGPFRIERFPFLREMHEVLSPEHPAREVTVRGSAQWGKTVSVIQPTVAAWHEYTPLDSLVVHPTTSAATEWVNNKWLPMRRQAPALRRIFGEARTGDRKDTTHNQETQDRNGSLKVASAGSPADLTGTSRRLVIMDDLSKFEMTALGDPEALAAARASGFEDAKILRVSTAMVAGTCRISRSYMRGDRRLYHVPCPHCGNMAPLTWENFRKSIDPERLAAAHFTCEACGCAIGHGDKEKIVGLGKWVPGNPRGDHPSFHLWRAYAPQRDWASIAVEYAQVMGWTRLELTAETEAGIAARVEAETEQTFWNDVLGLPYEQASRGPDWEALRDRVENADPAEQRPRGTVPARGVILTAGVDCQGDRTEVHIVAFGENYRRWAVDYIVIPHHIAEEQCWEALDALLKARWRTEKGLKLALDMMAIDGGAYTDTVWAYSKRHPWSRVIIVKGSSAQSGPVMVPQALDRRADGKAKKRQRRAFNINVSQLKADFYGWLAKDDPVDRGFVHIPVGLGDEYFRMLVSEVRVIKRSRAGVATSQWDLVEPTRRNEGLDTMLYAEAAARRKGWTSMTAEQWAALEAERSAEPEDGQPDLFDATVPAVAAQPTPADPQPDRGKPQPAAGPTRPAPASDDWLGGRGDRWQR
jgi:phage terminase large subunit GpA-like protein